MQEAAVTCDVLLTGGANAMRGWATSRGAQHVSAKEARSFVTTTQRSSIQFRRPEQVRRKLSGRAFNN